MANGNHALQLVDPPSAFVCAPSGKADADPSEIEKKIGAATAASVIGLALGISNFADRGTLTLSSRTWAGAMLGRLTELRLNTLGEVPDFAEVAFTEGRRALRAHPARVVLTHLGQPGQVDAVVDELISHVLAVSAKVASDEQAAAAN